MTILNLEQYGEIGLTILSVLVVILIGVLLYFFSNRGLKMLLVRDTLDQSFYLAARNIAKWIILLSVIIVVLQQIGIKITSIITVLLTIAGMIAVGFIAVWSILSNVSCALFLIFYNLFQIGDEIEIIEPIGGTGLKGKVNDFNLMFTTLIETAEDGSDNCLTQVPNNVFFQKTIRRKKAENTTKLGQHLISKPLRPEKPIETEKT